MPNFDDDDELLVERMDAFTAASEELPSPMIAPDGTLGGNLLQPEPIPEATPENFVCLRGPCRNYVEIKRRFDAGNTKGSLGHVPIQTARYCHLMAGYPIELTEENIYDCNRWEPFTLVEIKSRDEARKAYDNKESSDGR